MRFLGQPNTLFNKNRNQTDDAVKFNYELKLNYKIHYELLKTRTQELLYKL